jgi:hypothetical protein
LKAIRKGIELVRIALMQPQLLKSALHENGYWKEKFHRRYGHTRPLQVVDLSEIVPDEAVLQSYTFLGGSSMVTDLLLLKHLAKRKEVTTYFEIGTWRGESLEAVLPDVSHAFSLDTLSRAQRGVLVNDTGKVTWLIGDSAQFDFSAVKQKSDLIFIDGNHAYEYVRNDTEAILQYIAHDQSVIVWHDYGYDPEEIRWEVYNGILDAISPELHKDLYHVRHTKCAVLCRNAGWTIVPELTPGRIDHVWEVSVRRRPFGK